MAGMSFAWRAVAPSPSASNTFWSPESMAALERSMAAAREHLAAGRVEEAVAGWEAILREIPGIPAPRRQSVRRLIRDTVCACARRALQGPVPNTKAALRWLHRAIPSTESMPQELRPDDRLDDREQADVLQAYGLLLHLSADLRGALRYYEAAIEAGGSTAPLVYAVELARLQSAWATSESGVGGAIAVAGEIGTRVTLQAFVAGPDALHGPIRPAAKADPLLEPAWGRLRAILDFQQGDIAGALSGFPRPDTPALPRAWALEGALLSAMAADWPRSLQFYRRALGSRGFLDLPADSLHRYVFLAVAWQCVNGAASGRPLQTEQPGETTALKPDGPMHMVDIEELVMAERLPQRPPSGMFVSLTAYRAWANEIRRWQHRLWVGRALHLLPAGDDGELRRSLRAMMQLRPGSPVSRWIGVWLACTGGMAGSLRPLRDSYAPPGSPRHVLQLSVLAAERFGRQEHVIERLNLLLRAYPDDRWGLSRWRHWMLKLAEEATADGRYKQAFFQYVSLTLYLPDDADGWNGCARVLELLGDDSRAEDCRREAKRVERLGRNRDLPGAPERSYLVERDILRALLADPDDAPAAAAGFPFAEAALRRAVWESFQAPDVYLRGLLERWAGGPTNFPKVG